MPSTDETIGVAENPRNLSSEVEHARRTPDDCSTTPPTQNVAPGTFYGRLKREFPSQIIIDTTEVCNLACIHCPHPEFKKSDQYDGRFLDPEINRKLVDEVKLHGANCTEYLRYTGNGEPFSHKQIFEMLSYAKEHSGAWVCLTTNGTLLDERRIEKLLECQIHLVDISIDAYSPESYSKIRVNGKLEVTRTNVLRLLKRSREVNSETKVVVSYVEQPLNTHETENFEKFWRDQGASHIVIRRLHSAAGHVENTAVQINQKNQDKQRRPCLYPWERIVLNPKGQLAFCPADWVHGSEFADYRHTTIKEVWDGAFYKALRKAHCTNNYGNHGFCGNCPDWSLTKWPNEGRSYADMVEDFQARA